MKNLYFISLGFLAGIIVFVIIFFLCSKSSIQKEDKANTTGSPVVNIIDYSCHPSSLDLILDVINNGSIQSYNRLSILYLDRSRYDFLALALFMSNKYDYTQAYFDVYFALFELSNVIYDNDENLNSWSLENLDKKTQKMAIDYLKTAAEKGHEQANEVIDIYTKNNKYVKE